MSITKQPSFLSIYKDGRSTLPLAKSHECWEGKASILQYRSCSLPSQHVFFPYCSIMRKWVRACLVTQLSPTVCDKEYYWSKTKDSLLGEIRKEPEIYKSSFKKEIQYFPKLGSGKNLWGLRSCGEGMIEQNWWKQVSFPLALSAKKAL